MRVVTGKYVVALYFHRPVGKLFEIHVRDRIVGDDSFPNCVTHDSVQERMGIADSLAGMLTFFRSFSEKTDKGNRFDFLYLYFCKSRAFEKSAPFRRLL